VETFRPLRERSLEQLLWQVLSQRREGLVVLRDRDGLRHGVWVHAGFVVGVLVAGRFDPLLDVLRQGGVLDPGAYQACIEALWRSPARSGAIAMQVAGIGRPLVRDALKAQATARMRCLLELADTRGHDARFEPGDVPAAEMSVRLPLGSLLRAAQLEGHGPRPSPSASQALPSPAQGRLDRDDREAARRRLRALARTLHPDRNGHLDAVTRKRLEREMADATAAYHGFA
jgi:hypothetical protein